MQITSSPGNRPGEWQPDPSVKTLNTGSQQSSNNAVDNAGRQNAPGSEASRSPEQNRQSALQLVEQTLTMGYEKLAEQQRSAAGDFAQFEPLSADGVAGNILGFIEQRLLQDAAEGATQEQLQERLEQGLAGFERGFAQAREQLEALSMLSPEVSQDIGRTQELVLGGIDQLRQRILDGQLEQRQADSPEVTGPSPSPSGLTDYRYEQARATSFSFELTTAEGDRVEIQARASAGFANADDGEEQNLSASNSASMSWSVQGDLSESERAAISDLVADVDRLAGQFFEGDLEGALSSAQSLGYDQDEIVGFSLNLQQADIRRVSETYADASGSEQPVSQGLQQQLAPLGAFARDLEQARDNAAQVTEEPETLLLDTAQNLAAGDDGETAQEGQSLREFMQEMLQSLSSNREG